MFEICSSVSLTTLPWVPCFGHSQGSALELGLCHGLRGWVVMPEQSQLVQIQRCFDATLAMPLEASDIRPRAWLEEEGVGGGCDAQRGSRGQGAWWWLHLCVSGRSVCRPWAEVGGHRMEG